MMWFRDEPNRSWWACNVRYWQGEWSSVHKTWQWAAPELLGELNSHMNERDPKIMEVWDYMVGGRLIRIVWYNVNKQYAFYFW